MTKKLINTLEDEWKKSMRKQSAAFDEFIQEGTTQASDLRRDLINIKAQLEEADLTKERI